LKLEPEKPHECTVEEQSELPEKETISGTAYSAKMKQSPSSAFWSAEKYAFP
jgi:hypothetical protein